MLRKVRIVTAVVLFTLITVLFLDFTGTFHAWLEWLAKIQFLPAVLALNVGVIVFLILLTWVFGRVYCSTICPLGVMQDVISWLGRRRKKKKYRYSYSPAKSWLRYGVLAAFIIAVVLGIGSIMALLAPYSAYGRIVQNLFSPLYDWGNNLLAYVSERVDSYAFYRKEVWMRSIPTFIIAVVSFAAIAILAWRNGRTYCNTICPVGTVLGFLSRFSLLKVHIDETRCNSCGLCGRSCKASCIDSKNHHIDYSRCVACGDCIGKCHGKAISYGIKKKSHPVAVGDDSHGHADGKVDTTRRAFMVGAAIAATGVVLAQEKKKVDGGLAVIEDKVAPQRKCPITPPGSGSAKNMSRHCTGCQLCVSACPNDVLRPSTDWDKLMQPTMSYERGYCRPECTRCSHVCPTGAIKPVSREDKSSIQIGHAVWIRKNCIPITDGVECGNCARHCPVGAITMVASDPHNAESPKIPAVNAERCIGCGACENLCPARPFSAIYVEGHEMHRFV